MNKYFIFLIVFCSAVQAEKPKEPASNQHYIEPIKKQLKTLDLRAENLKIDLKNIETIQKELNTNLGRNIEIQNDIQQPTIKLTQLISQNNNKAEPLSVKLIQPIDYSIYLFQINTICIVVSGTFISYKTIQIKSRESLDALTNSNENQITISKINNESERLKSQEEILANSRQEWIKTLRDDIAVLTSNITQSFAATIEDKSKTAHLIWNEYYKVKLLLNPLEGLHNELVQELSDLIALCAKDNVTEVASEFLCKRDNVFDVSQKILKLEWNRLKTFER